MTFPSVVESSSRIRPRRRDIHPSHEISMHVEGNLPLLLTRLQQKKENPNRNDIRPMLVLEQGGYLGVLQAASLEAFAQNGFQADCFDRIYGSSTGAFSALFYALSQMQRGRELYARIVTEKIISFARIIGRRRPLDMHGLIDIIQKELPNAKEQLQKISTEVFVTHTMQNGQGRYIKLSERSNPIRDVAASANIPFMSNEQIHEEDGSLIYDGGIFDPTPISVAIQAGATDIMVMLAYPPDKAVVQKIQEVFLGLAPFGKPIKDGIRDTNRRRARQIQNARAQKDVNIVFIYPPDTLPIGPFRATTHTITQTYDQVLASMQKDIQAAL